MGASIKDVRTLGREGVSNNVDRSGQVIGRRLAVSGNPFQCGLCVREEGIWSFYDHLPCLED